MNFHFACARSWTPHYSAWHRRKARTPICSTARRHPRCTGMAQAVAVRDGKIISDGESDMIAKLGGAVDAHDRSARASLFLA